MHIFHIGNRMEQAQPDPKNVLSKALQRAQEQMGVDSQLMAAILGVNRSTLSRSYQAASLDPQQNPGRLAAIVLRIYRSVHTLMGGDGENVRHWFHTANAAFAGQSPLQAMQSVDGLVFVAQYCDAMRGRA